MEILNKEQAGSIEVVEKGRAITTSKNQHIIDTIKTLEEGQSLLVTKGEWIGKTVPIMNMSGIRKKEVFGEKKFHVFSLKDGSGWLIAPRQPKN